MYVLDSYVSILYKSIVSIFPFIQQAWSHDLYHVKDETWSMTSKNYFVENNRTTSVMIWKDRVNYEELLENT